MRGPPTLSPLAPVLRGEGRIGCQSMILFSGYSTMPRAPACLSCGTMCRTMFSSMIVFTATHSGSDSDEIVGVLQTPAGSSAPPAGRRLAHVHHQADLALGRHRALAASGPGRPSSALFHGSAVGLLVGDEARRALQQLGDDAQVVRPQRAAGLGHLDDGVGQPRRLDLGGAPAELDLGRRRRAAPASAASGRRPRWRCACLAGPSTLWIGESFGTASTQRTGRRLTLLKTSSASSTTLASFSRIQSWPVRPQSSEPSWT